jgi:hypothetical protein
MKKPIFNMVERLEMRETDCTIVELRKLVLATNHIRRDFQRALENIFNLKNEQTRTP